MTPKPSFSIVGCGRVGTTLARILAAKGYPVAGLASRSLSSAEAAAGLLRTDRVMRWPWEATPGADVVLITTPDDTIEPVCRSLADHRGFRKGAVVLHCSGVLSSAVLSSAHACGAHVGSMHPLQSIASKQEDPGIFQGILVSVEGDEEAKEMARRLAQDLGAHCAEVRSDAKTLYHAAAVVASNYLVTLVDLALALNATAGIAPQESVRGLMPLIQGTLRNIESQGIPNALTGPIARGDVQTVRKHLHEIGARCPDLLILYRTLGAHTVRLARAKESLTGEAAEALDTLLQ